MAQTKVREIQQNFQISLAKLYKTFSFFQAFTKNMVSHETLQKVIKFNNSRQF
jgi:hypothetical protein